MFLLATFSRPVLFVLYMPLVLLLACKPSQEAHFYQNMKDKQAAQVLQKAMDAAGGFEAWEGLRLISFEKRFALFSENGEIEQERKQMYSEMRGLTKANLRPDTYTDKDLLFQLGSDLIQIKGDINPDQEEAALRNIVQSASFVINLPFKLLDTMAIITYAGKDTLDQGQQVQVLKVTYDFFSEDNFEPQDIWWHYFDDKTYQHLAYMVQHTDHYSYVENLELTKVCGITFPLGRRSWRVDENRNLLYLRAQYEYSNYLAIRRRSS